MTNYILEYYQAIKDGTVTVGTYIKQWYAYLLKGLEDKAFFYAPKKAAAAILFIENYCRHSEGILGGQKVKLELWQKALVSVIFGIVDNDNRRQFREVVIVIGRKNGKTLLAAAISAYCAFLDGEYGGRIYFAAPKLEQASLCFNAFQQIVQTEPALNVLAQKRRTDIYIAESNSTIKPLAFSAKKSDGLNISLCVADEISSWQGDGGMKFYEVIRSSFGSRLQPLLLCITTAGYVTDGVYDELMKRATRLLKGDSSEKRLAPFLYIIDDPKKWNDINELQKSNPNLGVSVSVDYMLEEITIAEGSIPKRHEFLCKYCNVRQTSSFAWLSATDVAGMCGVPLDLNDFRDSYCVCGIDLSRTTDLTAITAVIEKNGVLYVFAHFFMPAEKLEEATARDGIPYQIYVERGFLSLSGDNFVDYQDCFTWYRKLIEEYQIYPLQTGYDRYSSQYLIQDIKSYGGLCDDVYQGYNLTPVVREMEGLIKDRKINIGDNDLLKIHLLSSALKYEAGTERVKLIKIKATEHIDGTAALLDALCVRQKWYGELGSRLRNEE